MICNMFGQISTGRLGHELGIPMDFVLAVEKEEESKTERRPAAKTPSQEGGEKEKAPPRSSREERATLARSCWPLAVFNLSHSERLTRRTTSLKWDVRRRWHW